MVCSPPPSTAGAAALAGLAACLYTVPWRSCRAAPPSAPKATRGFNVLWHGRALLALLLTAWGVSSAWASTRGASRVPPAAPQVPLPPAASHSCPPAFLPPPCPQLSPLLRVSRLWGANSFVFSSGVTSWTGAGWMCRWAVGRAVLGRDRR